MTAKGFVSLVGSGPGDPDLLTVKALRLIQQADVVAYDRLVSSEILRLIPHGVTQISVGKSSGKHCVPQDQINEMIVNLALTGRQLVRLKGGDPYIFGRGGEEARFLRRHGIPFEVVPGVTAASGCSSYSGIPLTYRGLAHSVRFITGHMQNDEALDLDWHRLADPQCTLVIYMGLANLASLCNRLIQAGVAPSTPAAAVHAGTTSVHRKIIANLSELSNRVEASGVSSPVTIIIGKVVALSAELDWFQRATANSEPEINRDSITLAWA